MSRRIADHRADREARERAGDTRHPSFLAVARRYTGRRVARGLDGLWVSGLPETRAVLSARPLIFASNHVAWWDSLLLVLLDEALGGLGWAVMDARNLKKLRALGWLGALPLDRSSPERSRECLHSAAALLDRPGRNIWIFPQGRQRPAHLRPLDLKAGLQIMHAHASVDPPEVDIVAVSINYVFLERDRPAAMVRFSEPIHGGGEDILFAVEAAMLRGLDVIDAAAREATDGRRARTDPRDPLPGFTALRRPARLRLPGRGAPDAG